MKLLIDDMKEDGWADIVARTGIAGLAILSHLKSDITELHIDFDLGDKSELNGLRVLEFALKYNCLPDTIWVVSLNPPGRKAMANFLIDNGYKQQGSKFERK